jgi:hypothetical protein
LQGEYGMNAKWVIWTATLPLLFNGLVRAQDPVPRQEPAGQEAPAQELLPREILPQEIQQEQTQQSAFAHCLQPPPLVNLDDYHGPFQKIAGTFARKLERKSAHAPRYKPDAVLCTLMPKDKFMLFVGDTRDPISFVAAAFEAGIDQAGNNDPTFGQGLRGYGKRFAADFASDTTGRFIMDFAYPTIFGEDPRYYRLGHGSGGKRLGHALEHAVIAHRDSGSRMFNFTEWLGTTTAVMVNNAYHPGNARGFGPTAEAVSISIGMDMGFDVLREFWPEVAHKLKLPFGERESFIHALGK